MEIDTGRHWVGLSEVYIILGECWLPSVDSVHSVHCNYCIPDTIVRINCEHFRLTPFVCGYNNWWQLKWDSLQSRADPLEAQAAESRSGEEAP